MDFNVTDALLTSKLGLDSSNAYSLAANLNLTANDVLIARDLAEIANVAADSIAIPLLLLADSVNSGSTCLRVSAPAVSAKLAKLDLTSDDVSSMIDRVPDSITGAGCPLMLENGGLYFQRHHKAENSLRDSFLRLLKSRGNANEAEYETVRNVLSEVMETTNYSLEHLQVLALLSALVNDFQIVSGGPGTGKTTIVLAYLRSLLKLGVDPSDIALAAPTGRAAKRISESIENGLRNDVAGENLEKEASALLSIKAVTLHNLLRYNPGKGGFQRNADNKLRAKVVVVDEVSMVDISLMAAFLAAVPEKCKLLLLGDQYQLPSVDAGAVLADLMPSVDMDPTYSAKFAEELTERLTPKPMGMFSLETRVELLNYMVKSVAEKPDAMTDHVTVLEVSKRFQKEIAELSGHVKRMDAAKVAELLSTKRVVSPDKPEPGWSRIDGVGLISSNCDWKRVVSTWLRDNLLTPDSLPKYRELVHDAEKTLTSETGKAPDDCSECFRRLFARIAASRILCLTHAGKFGVNAINAEIGSLVAANSNEDANGELFSGAFIMILRNNKRLNLFNGDVGMILRHSESGRLLAVFEDGQNFTVHAPNLIPAHRPAFAMTVHKSQGSEFERVLMPLPENPNNRLLTREVLYTGLTRAKKAVFIVSSDEALKAAVSRKTERHSGLDFS
ncbi:MAG: exodeoxyribonuclease V subunit alpha [Victivallales bacterium]|nr:exodeoxyribonuclease V subunit alpha [Victivallales bacterium]